MSFSWNWADRHLADFGVKAIRRQPVVPFLSWLIIQLRINLNKGSTLSSRWTGYGPSFKLSDVLISEIYSFFRILECEGYGRKLTIHNLIEAIEQPLWPDRRRCHCIDLVTMKLERHTPPVPVPVDRRNWQMSFGGLFKTIARWSAKRTLDLSHNEPRSWRSLKVEVDTGIQRRLHNQSYCLQLPRTLLQY